MSGRGFRGGVWPKVAVQPDSPPDERKRRSKSPKPNKNNPSRQRSARAVPPVPVFGAADKPVGDNPRTGGGGGSSTGEQKRPPPPAIPWPRGKVAEFLPRNSRRLLTMSVGSGPAPGEPGFRFRTDQLVDTQALMMDSDVRLMGALERGVLVARVYLDKASKKSPGGSFGSVVSFVPLTRGAVFNLAEKFGILWPNLELVLSKLLPVSRRVPKPLCDPLGPRGTAAQDCHVLNETSEYKHESARDDAPAMVPGAKFRANKKKYQGNASEFTENMVALVSALYAMPGLALKSTHMDENEDDDDRAEANTKTVGTLRSFVRAHRIGAKERSVFGDDSDRVMKVYRVDALMSERSGVDDDGDPVGTKHPEPQRLFILSEGVHMDVDKWRERFHPKQVYNPVPDYEGKYLCGCVKYAYSLFSQIMDLEREGCVHQDIKPPNSGAAFGPLRFFLLDLDCVSIMGLKNEGCKTYHDIMQLGMDSEHLDTEHSGVTNPFCVYGDLYRAALSVEMVAVDINQGKVFVRVDDVVRTGKAWRYGYSPEQVIKDAKARIGDSLDYLGDTRVLNHRHDSRTANEPMFNRARDILRAVIMIQLQEPTSRSAIVRDVLQECEQFFSEFHAQLKPIFEGDLFLTQSNGVTDETSVTFHTLSLL